MARTLFGGTASDVAEDASGARVPGAVGTVWDGPSAGATQMTDLRNLDGSPTDSLTADENGMIPSFLSPDMEPAPERLWVSFGGTRVALLATDVGDRLSTHLVADDPHGTLTQAANAISMRMGAPGGLATLDEDGFVQKTQLPGLPDWRNLKAESLAVLGDGTTPAILAQASSALAAQLLLLRDAAGTNRFEVSADGSAMHRAASFFTSGVQVGSTTLALGGLTGSGIGLTNVTAPPSGTPSNGGVLYAENGALKWKGSNGTITTLADA